MDCLVEVHDKKDLDIALNANAEIIGINNRNLKTMTTDLNTTIELSKHIPENTIIVSESAIKTKKDIEYLEQADIDAILVGTSIMKNDIEQKLKELAGAHR
ncbi:MAG: indole-3-glycerol-phosphate synthase TrpC, partial [archaeon]|nr:indole-3-glycerol-phosphate synthase TrpC [archaeon]